MNAYLNNYPFGAMAEGCSSAVSRVAALYGAAVVGLFAGIVSAYGLPENVAHFFEGLLILLVLGPPFALLALCASGATGALAALVGLGGGLAYLYGDSPRPRLLAMIALSLATGIFLASLSNLDGAANWPRFVAIAAVLFAPEAAHLLGRRCRQ